MFDEKMRFIIGSILMHIYQTKGKLANDSEQII